MEVSEIDRLIVESQTPEAKRSARALLRGYILTTVLGTLMLLVMFLVINLNFLIGWRLSLVKVSGTVTFVAVLFGIFAIVVLKLRDHFFTKRFQEISKDQETK